MSSSYTGPINPNPKDGEAGISIYGYVPSLALAIVGALTFAIVLALHGWQASRWRGTRSFHILMAVGSVRACGLGARIADGAVDGGRRLRRSGVLEQASLYGAYRLPAC
jgi:hypothetical protein